jgi:hypothetical protein
MISEVDTTPSNIKEAKKQAIYSSDNTEICCQCKLPISPPSWGFDVPLATALCKTFLLRILINS